MSKKDTLKKLLKYIGKNRIYVIVILLISIPAVLCTLLIPVLSGNAVDIIGNVLVTGNTQYSEILPVLIEIVICSVVYAILKWSIDCLGGVIAHKTVKNIRTDAIKKINRLPVSYTDSHSKGGIINKIITDADRIADGLVMGFKEFFIGVLTICGTFVFMIRINITVTAVVVLLTPLSLFIAGFISKKTYSLFKKDAEIRGRHASYTEEMISGRGTVKSCCRENAAEEKFSVLNEELRKCSLKSVFFSSLVNPLTRFTNGIIYALVAFSGAFICMSGDFSAAFTVGSLSCFLTYASQFAKPFNEISEVIAELQDSFACASGVFSFLEEKEETDDSSLDSQFKSYNSETAHVVFDNVNFSYDISKPLIKDFSLDVAPGTKVAIVGKTGAGKTTLVNILMRFYDCTDGKITVDGFDCSRISRNALRSRFGMVLQDTWLASGTVYENLSYGKPGISLEAVKEASTLTHAHDFIRKLPSGYDTFISDDNTLLSEGQKQLLCITRALIADPSVLILDEATSSVDTMTEQRIKDATDRLTENKTTFTVAHRLSTIRNADIILFIDKGNVAEAGSHEELLKKGGLYAALYNSQFEEN